MLSTTVTTYEFYAGHLFVFAAIQDKIYCQQKVMKGFRIKPLLQRDQTTVQKEVIRFLRFPRRNVILPIKNR